MLPPKLSNKKMVKDVIEYTNIIAAAQKMKLCLGILDKIYWYLARDQYTEAALATGDLASQKTSLFLLVEGFASKEIDSCNIADGLEKHRVEKALRDVVTVVLIATVALMDINKFAMELAKPTGTMVSNAKDKTVKSLLRAKAIVKSAEMVIGHAIVIMEAINLRDKRKLKNERAEDAMDNAFEYIRFFKEEVVKEAPASVITATATDLKDCDVKSTEIKHKVMFVAEVVAEVSRWHKPEDDKQLQAGALFVHSRFNKAKEVSAGDNLGAPPTKYRKTM